MSDVLKIHPGVFLLMEEMYRNSICDFADEKIFIENYEYRKYFDRLPPNTMIVEIVKAFKDRSRDYGVEDLYVVAKGSQLYGVSLYRAVGKHADYNELYEYPVPENDDTPDDEVDFFELKRLSTKLVTQYYFEGDG